MILWQTCQAEVSNGYSCPACAVITYRMGDMPISDLIMLLTSGLRFRPLREVT